MTMTSNKTFFVLFALAGLAVSLGGCGGPATVPKSYSSYKAEDGSFKIEYPAEWTVEGGGKGGYGWAKFTSGNSEIKVTTSLVGSLMADISKIQHPPILKDLQGNEDTAPVAIVHEQEKEEFEEETGVKEKAAAFVGTAVNDARKAEFSGESTFGGSIHGYRVTALTPDRRIRIVCQCPEGEWKSLQPAFDKIILTLSRGK
jgi:hypothetical protein